MDPEAVPLFAFTHTSLLTLRADGTSAKSKISPRRRGGAEKNRLEFLSHRAKSQEPRAKSKSQSKSQKPRDDFDTILLRELPMRGLSFGELLDYSAEESNHW